MRGDSHPFSFVMIDIFYRMLDTLYGTMRKCDETGGTILYKLVAIDIDGTLINDRAEMTKDVHTAIQAAIDKGVKIVLCTGRPIGGLVSFVNELNLTQDDDYIIAFNGALTQNNRTGDVMTANLLTYQDLTSLYELSQKVNTSMHFFDSDNVYTPNKQINRYTIYEAYANHVPLYYQTIDETPTDIRIPKVMFVGDEKQLNQSIDMIPEAFKERYTMVKSAPYFLEIFHPTVSKGHAVKQLANKLSIHKEDIVCIGDGGNDLSMITYAGCGVAMANADPAVKEAADFHTLSNNDNGVAYALEKLILTE